MLLAGMLWGACNGTWNEVTQALLDSAKESVSLGLTMLGILSFWCGIMEIGSRAGLVRWLTGCMAPVLDFLFPELERDHPAREPIAVNIIANMLKVYKILPIIRQFFFPILSTKLVIGNCQNVFANV